jgi:hypothetical protein
MSLEPLAHDGHPSKTCPRATACGSVAATRGPCLQMQGGSHAISATKVLSIVGSSYWRKVRMICLDKETRVG